MHDMSRRRFLQWTAVTGGALAFGGLMNRGTFMDFGVRMAYADEPIKIGILDPLSSPYKTSSIHDVHGANVAVDLFNKKGGVLGRPVAILEADDASNPDQAVKVATKFIKDDRVDVLMGTFNGDCALAVSALAAKENKLFMVTAAHAPELSGAACNSHTFVFMPHARMLAHAVVPHLAKAYGTRWFMITASTIDGKSCAQALVDASQAHKIEIAGETVTPFGTTDFGPAFTAAKEKQPTAVILNLYGWDLVNALKGYAKLELAKEKIGRRTHQRRTDRTPAGLCRQRRDLGVDLGPQDQYGKFQAFYSGRDRQVQPHADVTMLSGLCCDDTNPGSHSARRQYGYAGPDQGPRRP